MSFSDTFRRGKKWFFVAIPVVVIVIILVLFFSHQSREQSIENYKGKLEKRWGEVASHAKLVTQATEKIQAEADFPAVGKVASEMLELLGKFEAEKVIPPGGFEKVGELEKRALASLGDYLSKLVELSENPGKEKIDAEKVVLESLAQSAFSKTNDFLSKADFLKIRISGDFFQAGTRLASVYEVKMDEKEKEEIYRVVETFMEADVREYKPDVLLGLFCTRLRTVLPLFYGSKEGFAQMWKKAWMEGKKATDYYVSKASLAFLDPMTATIKVVAYFPDDSAKVESLRLIKEADGWKLDNYPFVGLL